ncbi:MAG: hypothetical protein K2O28_03155 [Clostridia bacterium]|nr:hypothetical protein [Clostridia bacterium]
MKKVFKGLSILVASAALCGGIATATACSGGGYDGKYYGEYHYLGYYGQEYGMVVEVTVENNIITAVKDLTNDKDNEHAKQLQTYKTVTDGKEADEATWHEWHAVSAGWDSYFLNGAKYWALYTTKEGDALHGVEGYEDGKSYYAELDSKGNRTGNYLEWDGKSVVPEASTKTSYGWSTSSEENWTKHTSWLLNQYVGKSAAEVLELKVYTNYGYAWSTGASDYNTAVDKDAMGEPYGKDYNADLAGSGLLLSGATQGSGRLLLAVQDALKK